MSIKITGLDKLQRELDQAIKAFEALDGELATLKFNPKDQSSVEKAIADMELAIDAKIGAYRGNATVENVASQLKKRYAAEILQRSSLARLNENGETMSPNQIDQTIFRQIENTVSDLRSAEYNTFSRRIKNYRAFFIRKVLTRSLRNL